MGPVGEGAEVHVGSHHPQEGIATPASTASELSVGASSWFWGDTRSGLVTVRLPVGPCPMNRL